MVTQNLNNLFCISHMYINKSMFGSKIFSKAVLTKGSTSTLPPKLNILGYTAVTMKAFRDLAGDAAKDVMGVSAPKFVYTPEKPIPEQTKKFIDALDKKYGTERDTILYVVATHYDAVKLLAEAMKKAGPDNPEKIKEVLEGITNFEGVADTYNFSPSNHDGSNAKSVRIVWAAKLDRGCFEGVSGK
ncbi:MAG: ABC transporter substrate-binding protein [Bacillota bacterium]